MSIHHKVNDELVEFASKVSFNEDEQKLTINGNEYAIKTNTNLYGNEGEVLYVTPRDIKKQTILHSNIYVCEDNEDEQKSLNSEFSLEEVFNNWERSGRYNDMVQGYTNYPHNCGTLTDAFNMPEGYRPNPWPLTSYNQLVSEIPQQNWKVYEWCWTRDPADHYTLTSRISSEIYCNFWYDIAGYGSEYWVYNTAISSILQPLNTSDWACYISPDKYINYDLEVELASPDGDNDYIGLVAAFNTDSTGFPHQLNLIRVGGVNDKGCDTTDKIGESGHPIHEDNDNSYYTWYAQLDTYGWASKWNHRLAIGGFDITGDDVKTGSLTAYNKVNRRWNNGGKTRIKIKRRGDRLEAWTTPFYRDGDPIPSYEGHFDIDLENLVVDGQTFTCFSQANGGGKIGFLSESQPMSYYKIINFKVEKRIIKTNTNELVTYDIDGIRTSTPGKMTEIAGIGRFIKNTATNKTFYVGDSSFIKIANSVINVEYDDANRVLTINGINHSLKNDVLPLLFSTIITNRQLINTSFIITDLMPQVPFDITVVVMFKNYSAQQATTQFAYELDGYSRVELPRPDRGTKNLCPLNTHQSGGNEDFAHYSLQLHMRDPADTRIVISNGNSQVNVAICIYKGLIDNILPTG